MEYVAAGVTVGYALKGLLVAGLAVAALTPTPNDDNALHRAANLLDKLLGWFSFLPRK